MGDTGTLRDVRDIGGDTRTAEDIEDMGTSGMWWDTGTAEDVRDIGGHWRVLGTQGHGRGHGDIGGHRVGTPPHLSQFVQFDVGLQLAEADFRLAGEKGLRLLGELGGTGGGDPSSSHSVPVHTELYWSKLVYARSHWDTVRAKERCCYKRLGATGKHWGSPRM